MAFPLWRIEEVEHDSNGSAARLVPASTYYEADDLRALLAPVHATVVRFGSRSDDENSLSVLVTGTRQMYVGDSLALNVERHAREQEVRDILADALAQGCTLEVLSTRAPETSHLGPLAAARALGRADAERAATVEDAIHALNRVLGRS